MNLDSIIALPANSTSTAENRDCNMENTESDKNDAEFHLASEMADVSPRSAQSGLSSGEVFGSPIGKETVTPRLRPKSAKTKILRPIPTTSSIPLPVKNSGPIRVPSLLRNTKSVSRTSSGPTKTVATVSNKHTLEIQFLNKNKRFVQMRKEVIEKQRPLIDLYQNLTQIKKRLEDLGKTVKLEDVKLVSYEEFVQKPAQPSITGAGEQPADEIVEEMRNSIKDIPTTLLDICRNLLSRRALIVELLESVTKSEVDMLQVSNKIESLKHEGEQLQQSLNMVVEQHDTKINDLVKNWIKLLNDKQCSNMDGKIDELEAKLKEEERMREESTTVIHELHRKMDDRKAFYEKSVSELNGMLQSLRDQVKKLEQDLENERKTSVDFKTRNNNNAQNLKSMRTKITELETEKKELENYNSEMERKMRLLQDQFKHKEAQWVKEKEEMSKSLKHQENLLQKLTADKNHFETRLESFETEKTAKEEELQATIVDLEQQLQLKTEQLTEIEADRNEFAAKCNDFESYVARMGAEFRETMNKVSYSVEWGKTVREIQLPEAENYMQDMAKDHRICELEDKIWQMGQQQESCSRRSGGITNETLTGQLELKVKTQQEYIKHYQMLLEQSEKKLKCKLNDLRSVEIEHLRAEIRHLKVRQEALEEQNQRCTSKELQRMLDEGRKKLTELMQRSLNSEKQVEEYKEQVQKQTLQMSEMDSLLRYRENMAGVLKASRNELLLEKESLTRYSKEIRAALAEVTSQIVEKDTLICDLEERVDLRESQLQQQEKQIQELEEKLHLTNEKRYKLQETVSVLEKQLQNNLCKKQLVNRENDRGGTPWRFLDCVCEVMEDKKPNKNVSHYYDSLKASRNESDFNKQNSYSHISNNNNNTTNDRLKKPSRHKFHPSQTKQDFDNLYSLRASEISTNNTSYRNSVFSDKPSSIHTHCHHKANSRSLISLSLQKVDYMKTKLNFLTSLNAPPLIENPSFENDRDEIKFSPETCSFENDCETIRTSTQTVTPSVNTPNRNLSKILELTTHRYEYLQNQAQESYDELANLVKLAVAQKGGMRK